MYGGTSDLRDEPKPSRINFWELAPWSMHDCNLKPSHLYRSGGGRILSELWEQLAQPGWKVQHTLEDPTLNRFRFQGKKVLSQTVQIGAEHVLQGDFTIPCGFSI